MRACPALHARACRRRSGRLLEAYAEESAILDHLARRSRRCEKAVTRWREAGDPAKEGEALAALAWPLVRSGRNAEAEDASRQAIACWRRRAPGRPLGRAYRIQGAPAHAEPGSRAGLRWGGKSIALARRFDDAETLAAAHTSSAPPRSSPAIPRARCPRARPGDRAPAPASTRWLGLAYLNLGTACGEIYRFDLAERYLADGIAYAVEMDLGHAHHYMLAWQGLMRMYQGRWPEAGEAARAVTEAPDVSIVARIMALVALGRLRTRRGDPGAAAALDEALELAAQTGTLQRLAPVRAARAEAAWLDGDRADAPGGARRLRPGVPPSTRLAYRRAGVLAAARR